MDSQSFRDSHLTDASIAKILIELIDKIGSRPFKDSHITEVSITTMK